MQRLKTVKDFLKELYCSSIISSDVCMVAGMMLFAFIMFTGFSVGFDALTAKYPSLLSHKYAIVWYFVILVYMLFVLPFASFLLGPLFIAVLWAIPSFLFFAIFAVVYAIVQVIRIRFFRYGFLTRKELAGGYIDFSKIGGDDSDG